MFLKTFEEICKYVDTTDVKPSERLMIMVGKKSARQNVGLAKV